MKLPLINEFNNNNKHSITVEALKYRNYVIAKILR